jgi:aspartyl-tRNA(Asn)/glutamyl-tRNA(Gln) amidotransferase subunit A
VRYRLEAARYVLAADYVRALAGQRQLRHEVDAALVDVDALVLPTLAIPAPPVGAATVGIDGKDYPLRNVMLRLTQLFNLSGHPAVSLCCGFTSDGLPCGLQLVGARMQTATLMRFAHGVESALSG